MGREWAGLAEWQQKQDPPLGSQIRFEASPTTTAKSELSIQSARPPAFKLTLKTREGLPLSWHFYTDSAGGGRRRERTGPSSCSARLFSLTHTTHTETHPAYLKLPLNPPPHLLSPKHSTGGYRQSLSAPKQHLCLQDPFSHTKGKRLQDFLKIGASPNSVPSNSSLCDRLNSKFSF